MIQLTLVVDYSTTEKENFPSTVSIKNGEDHFLSSFANNISSSEMQLFTAYMQIAK